MRLTLRTLLAYLDDTLEPSETKQIGQKVAESDAAQELIARIKQVTRRRRLATPPLTGPGAKWDANVVASYLDSTLTPEEVAEIEKACLDSDIHLAEVAGVHQILTLVVGEPALVPPPAKERMYGLVRGREAVRRRKAPSGARRPEEAVAYSGADDDPLLLGLPQYRRSNWLRWFLPVAALLLIAGLSIAVLAVVQNLTRDKGAEQASRTTSRSGTPTPDDQKTSGNGEDSKTEAPHLVPVSQVAVAQGFADFLDKLYAANHPIGPGPGTTDETPSGPWLTAASTKRVPVGQYDTPPPRMPYLLVQRPSTAAGAVGEGWERVLPRAHVNSTDTLVAPPGCRSELVLDKGINVYLWGNVAPMFLSHLPIYESAIVVNASDRHDLDLTLLRGRIILINRKEKGAAHIRLRFYQEEDHKVTQQGKEETIPGRKEVWDLTLVEPDTEIGVERVAMPAVGYGNSLPPQVELYLIVLKGQAKVRVSEFRHFDDMEAAPGPALLQWSNVGGEVQKPERIRKETLEFWNKVVPTTPAANVMKDALDELLRGMNDKNVALNVAAQQMLEGQQPAGRTLGIFWVAAVDNLPALLGALGDARDDRVDVRNIAGVALRMWIGRNDGNDKVLYELLLKKRYSRKDAQTILELLHGFSEDDVHFPRFWEELINYLKHQKVEIRQLASFKLKELVPQGRNIPYNPAGDTSQVEAAIRAWKEIIPDGKLPPPSLPGGAGPGGGAPPPN